MQTIRSSFHRLILFFTFFSVCFFGMSAPSYAELQRESQKVGPFDIAMDLAIVRPIGIVATAAGAVVFVVGAPFSLLAGVDSLKDTFDILVADPAQSTFFRCLGCKSVSREENVFSLGL